MLHKVSFGLVIIGGLNWLLEAFGWGIGGFLPNSIAQIIYILVGLSALYLIFTHKHDCKSCQAKGGTSMGGGQQGQMGGM